MIKKIFQLDELMAFIEATAVDDVRHKHYDHTVALAGKAYQYMTGEDQDDILLSYKTKESDTQKQQRLRVTNSVTQSVSNTVKAQFEELARVDNVVENHTYEEVGPSFQKMEEEIESRLDVFYQDHSLTDYLHEAVLHLNFYDPNAFIVVESRYADDDPNRKRKPWTYPLEVYANQAVNFSFDNGVLQWLVARHEITYKRKAKGLPDATVKAGKYTIYAARYNIVMQELPDDVEYQIPDGWERVTYARTGKKDKTFLVKVFETGIDFNPAIRVGYIKDPATNRETCVTPLWPADKIYRDLIWTKSEYDLAKALHGFYQKFQYAPACDAKDPDTGQKCQHGQLNGAACNVCKGTGVQVHTTVQDVIFLKMPNRREEIIPLSDLIHYENIPIELIERNNKDIAENEVKVMKAVFQRDLINKSEVASTATEVRVTENSKYNILSTYGMQWSRIWVHCVKATAHYLEVQEGLIVSHEFSSDFVIETLSELFEQRQKAIQAQAPYSIIRNIDRKILLKQNRDSSDVVKAIEAKERWRPFREKSETERLTIVSQLGQDHPLRVRYEYFEEIFDEIFSDREQPPFQDQAWQDQKVRVDAIVARIIADNAPAVQAGNLFRNIITGAPAEEEE